MRSGATELHLTYGDTIGDLALSLTGSVTAGLLMGWRARRKGEVPAGEASREPLVAEAP